MSFSVPRFGWTPRCATTTAKATGASRRSPHLPRTIRLCITSRMKACRIFVLNAQPAVDLTLEGTDARLIDSGDLGLQVSGTSLTTLWIPPATDGRLRVRTVGDMTVEILATVFPDFQFDPIFGLDLSPIGLFHTRPVTVANDENDGALRGDRAGQYCTR